MPERVSLIEIYSALRESNVSKPVATAVATATCRVLNDADRKAEPLVAALRSNARFAALVFLVTLLSLAIVQLLTLR